MPRGHPRQRVGRPGCRAGGRAPPLPGASRCSSGSRGGSRSGRDNFSPASKAAAARPAPGPPTRPRPPLGPAPGPAPGRRLVKDAGEKVLASGSRCAEEEHPTSQVRGASRGWSRTYIVPERMRDLYTCRKVSALLPAGGDFEHVT
uniref:Uncharacterized protein n=1 Tax=Rangifer tarandus platyrhynchus TaxID=3082113 RepID=A0ACB0E3U0_RANTA|nr:unnamed protein product [Rangifer tarandus platyrhynchus]